MMISEGKGMHADSTAINNTPPEYPRSEIVATMRPERISMMRATIRVCVEFPVQNILSSPAMLSNQRDKSTAAVVLFPCALVCLDHANEALHLTQFANGNHQPATNLELRYQRFRNAGTGSGNEDCIVWCMRCPAERAIEAFDRCVVDFQQPDSRLCVMRKFSYTLNRINLGRD